MKAKETLGPQYAFNVDKQRIVEICIGKMEMEKLLHLLANCIKCKFLECIFPIWEMDIEY